MWLACCLPPIDACKRHESFHALCNLRNPQSVQLCTNVYHIAAKILQQNIFLSWSGNETNGCLNSTRASALQSHARTHSPAALKKPTSQCWCSPDPYGHNQLSQTVSRLYKEAGIQGYKANHSLRVSTATLLSNWSWREQGIEALMEYEVQMHSTRIADCSLRWQQEAMHRPQPNTSLWTYAHAVALAYWKVLVKKGH